KTTPHPKVASGGLRSTTSTSSPGLDFFASSAKYSPDGPPPRTAYRIALADSLGQLVDLLDARDRREQHQLIATGVFITADEVGDRARRGQISCGDLLRKWPGKRVVMPQIFCACIGGAMAEREIAHSPQTRPAGPAQVGPGRDGLGHGSSKRARRSTAVHVAVRVACHAGERLTARPTDQQMWAGCLRSRPDPSVRPDVADRFQLLAKAPASAAAVD